MSSSSFVLSSELDSQSGSDPISFAPQAPSPLLQNQDFLSHSDVGFSPQNYSNALNKLFPYFPATRFENSLHTHPQEILSASSSSVRFPVILKIFSLLIRPQRPTASHTLGRMQLDESPATLHIKKMSEDIIRLQAENQCLVSNVQFMR